ncbi:hypothetical protein [Methylobacterium oxalidis]|uniref:hypothetical protein n=1 Tax=Methylobacterium oxalidis TaxID=944322 RepID=UPI0033153E9F
MTYVLIAAGGFVVVGMLALIRMVRQAPLCDDDELERVAREVQAQQDRDGKAGHADEPAPFAQILTA